MCDYNCDVCEQPCGSCAGAIAPVKATEAMTQPVGQRHGQLYTEPANATIEQTTGQSTTTVMSQKAVTDAVEGRVPSSSEDSISISSEGDISLSAVVDVGIVGDQVGIHATDDVIIEGNNIYINGTPYRSGHQLVQSTGNSTSAVMSQKAVTDAINAIGASGWTQISEVTLEADVTSLVLLTADTIEFNELYFIILNDTGNIGVGNNNLISTYYNNVTVPSIAPFFVDCGYKAAFVHLMTIDNIISSHSISTSNGYTVAQKFGAKGTKDINKYVWSANGTGAKLSTGTRILIYKR